MTDDSAQDGVERPFLEADALAGIVDLFGATTREELREATAELAFKRAEQIDEGTVNRAIDAALAEYALVVVEGTSDRHGDAQELLTVGPTAFPTLPDGAADLPHILDIDGDRRIDRDALARNVEDRLRREAARAAADGNQQRLETLLDVCFDVDIWADVDTDDVRADIERALE